MSTSENNLNYTDEHNVDEDLRAISLHGGDWGMWWSGTVCGVFLRIMGEYSSSTGDLENVASSDISRLIIYYTDYHDVDEDIATIPSQGGCWYYVTTIIGVMYRDLNNSHIDTFDSAASLKNIGHSR